MQIVIMLFYWKICKTKIKFTSVVTRPATAATPRVLNRRDPIMVPTPTSESVINVLTLFVKNSGVVVAVAIKVAAATSYECDLLLLFIFNKLYQCCYIYLRNIQVGTDTFNRW